MVQVKITGLRQKLNPIRSELSDIIHSCLQDAIGTPENKRFQRFFPLEREDFYYPDDRSTRYTIIEIVMFELPKHNWGIRGLPGDELNLNYVVET